MRLSYSKNSAFTQSAFIENTCAVKLLGRVLYIGMKYGTIVAMKQLTVQSYLYTDYIKAVFSGRS